MAERTIKTSNGKVFRVKIETGNAAFSDGNRNYEIARILRELADKLEHGHEPATVRDINGNTVGTVTAA